MNRALIPLSALAVILLFTISVLEITHVRKYGHLLTLGLHTDIVLGNSDVARTDTYFVRLWNLSVKPIDLDGCFQSNDVIGAPPSILFRWDIQRWNSSRKAWDSLHGADSWVHEPYGGYWREEPCRSATRRISPLGKFTVAWVYKGWVTSGEPIRVAVHMSTTAQPNSQNVIFTRTFVVGTAHLEPDRR
jgi:hypothetical protein